MSINLLLTGIVVFITHALEAITGFGCTVLAFPFVTQLLDIKEAKVILSIIAWILALYIVLTKLKKINLKQFFIIVLFVGIGMPAGIYFFNELPSDLLKLFLGIFIVVTSVIQLRKIYHKKDHSKLPKWFYYIILVVGGIVHGAFASGGPFVVLYAARNLPDKGEFRATLCLLWTSLNTALFFTDPTFVPIFSAIKNTVVNKAPMTVEMVHLLWMIPFLVAGIIVGELVHNKVDGEKFKKLVFLVLLATGIFMVGAFFTNM